VKISKHGVEPTNNGVILAIGGQSAVNADEIPIENANRGRRVIDYMRRMQNGRNQVRNNEAHRRFIRKCKMMEEGTQPRQRLYQLTGKNKRVRDFQAPRTRHECEGDMMFGLSAVTHKTLVNRKHAEYN